MNQPVLLSERHQVLTSSKAVAKPGRSPLGSTPSITGNQDGLGVLTQLAVPPLQPAVSVHAVVCLRVPGK